MSSTQVNNENKIEKLSSQVTEKDNNNEQNENQKRFEGKVSAEQEISATVARRRRNISKKRSESAHRPREVTPARDLQPETNVDEDTPKKPESKVRKTSSNNSNSSGNSATTSNDQKEPSKFDNVTKTTVPNLPIPPSQIKTQNTKPRIQMLADNGDTREVDEKPIVKVKQAPAKEPRKVDAKTGPESPKNAAQFLEKLPDAKMEEIKKENMKTAAKIIEKVKKSEGVQTPNASIDNKETSSTGMTEVTVAESPKERDMDTDIAEKEPKPAEIDTITSSDTKTLEIGSKSSENVTKIPGSDTNSRESATKPSQSDQTSPEESKKIVSPPPREKPARMKRNKLLKKRSQSQPRPTTEEDEDRGSRLDLEVQKERLKKEQLIELPKGPGRPKPIRKNKEIIPISPESVLAPTPRDLVEDFKQAQVLSAKLEVCFKPSSSESSVESSETSSSQNGTVRRRVGKPYAPAAQQYLELRRLEKQLSASKKEDEDKVVPSKKKWMSLQQFREHWKRFKLDHQEECYKIRNLRNRCLNEIGLLMISCGLGALLFKYTEGALENFYKCGVKRVKRDFIDFLWIRSHSLREEDWKALARVRLRDFEEQLHTAHEAGVQSYSGQRSWSFLNGIVYALTIVTTIGYGHMYPTTTTGRALTIVYALIGIPLFLIILTDFGKLFTRMIKFCWAFVRRVYYTGTCKKARKTTAVKEVMKGAQMMYDLATFRRPSQFQFDENDPNRPREIMEQPQNIVPHTSDIEAQPDTPAPSNFEIDDEFNLPISVALTILIIYMFAGAVFYLYWEDWDFFASFYFVFISMSTIGFGDYVPRHPICMIVSIIYLVFGLALMSMCINVVQVKLSDTFKQASTKLGATIGLRVNEDDGSITTVPPPSVEIPEVHQNTNNMST